MGSQNGDRTQLNVDIEPELRRAVHLAARARGESTSDFVSVVLLREVRKVDRRLARLGLGLAELARREQEVA
jgi:uncharacterized protein (DUF1778 family)